MADCMTCAHSIGVDTRTAEKLRLQGYDRGAGDFLDGVGLVCEWNKVIASVAYQGCGYRYEPGSGG